MATRKRAGGQPPASAHGQDWRGLGALERFAVLLNHYGSADALASASGIPARSLRAVFTSAILNGKRSRVIESDEYREGFMRARHKMTDQLRRVDKKAQAGKYEAPLMRTKTTLIAPQRHHYTMLHRDYHGKIQTVTSRTAWFHYNVEFLSDDEIWNLLHDAFELFMDTGQFNIARYIFLCDADIYPGESGFVDKDYRADAEANKIISVGSNPFPFPEYTSGSEFANSVMDDWAVNELKGGVRITKIYFASMGYIATSDALKAAKAEFERNKQKRGRNGKQKGKGRGI
jgi:hypothetical protein